MKQFLTYVKKPGVLIPFFLGVILFLVNLWVTNRWFMEGGLEHVALALLITVCVTAVLHYSFERSLGEKYSLLKGAEQAGVLEIFKDREEALPRINEEIQRGRRRIDILCVSGTSFFMTQESDVFKLLRKTRFQPGVAFRILLSQVAGIFMHTQATPATVPMLSLGFCYAADAPCDLLRHAYADGLGGSEYSRSQRRSFSFVLSFRCPG